MRLVLDDRHQHDFNASYHQILIRSGLFTDVKYEIMSEHDRMLELDKIVYPNGRAHKRGQISFARINGKLIVFDTQFNDSFSINYIKNGLLDGLNPVAYIKYCPNKELQMILPCQLKTWVMFPAGWTVVNSFLWNQSETVGIMLASGKHSLRIMKRTQWFDKAIQLGYSTHISIPQTEFAKLLRKSRWGVILSIRNEKNTREYEFISCHMPLALNYVPYYEFPFEPGVHYYKMDSIDDLAKLNETNPSPFHDASKELWENYFRPDKATNLLLSWA